jgi:hypothetical protein
MAGTARGRVGLNAAVWCALLLAALLYQALNLFIAFDPDDTENLETTRVMAAARQLVQGPGGLYGPYSGANPWVLIQAPLYYRLTGLLAWPLAALGWDPIWACFAAGRALSMASFLAGLLVVYRVGTLDGAPIRAGVLSVALALGTPLIGSFPVTMRPDMLGVFLQLFGVWLVLRAVLASRGTVAHLIAAYIAFALAFCVKQHYVVGAALSSCLLGWAWSRGQINLRSIVLAHVAGGSVALAYLGFEQVLTGGAMFNAVAALPGQLRHVTAGSWGYAAEVFWLGAKRTCGLLALGVACVLAGAGAGSGRQIVRRLDWFLVAFACAELGLMLNLCLGSAGAWYNYGIQAVLLLCVLVGRRLVNLLGREWSLRRAALIGCACLVLVASVARAVAITVETRTTSHATLRALLSDERVASHRDEERYFGGPLQHFNRRFGNPRLLHDEWLYGAFEQVGAAEPRSRWLRESLVRGPIRQVVLPREVSRVAGVTEPLPDLGYEPVADFGAIRIWQIRPFAAQRPNRTY